MSPEPSKNRRFYPTQAVENMMKERREISPFTKSTDYVFPAASGGRLADVPKIFTRCFDHLGINKEDTDPLHRGCFHVFRHSFATKHARMGADMRTLAGYLGHSVLKITERYAHFSPDAAEKALDSVVTRLSRF